MAYKVKQTNRFRFRPLNKLQIDFANKATMKILVFRQRIRARNKFVNFAVAKCQKFVLNEFSQVSQVLKRLMLRMYALKGQWAHSPGQSGATPWGKIWKGEVRPAGAKASSCRTAHAPWNAFAFTRRPHPDALCIPRRRYACHWAGCPLALQAALITQRKLN